MNAREAGLLGGLLIVALLSAACGDHAGHTGGAGGGMDHAMDGGVVPGAPADVGDSSRDIEIVATDEPAFRPSSVTISAGEVVTFLIRNRGNVDHEFVLGDEAYQEMHESDMQGDHSMEMENAVTVAPGETEKLTWEFDEAGEVLYGCHEPGHYEDGMVGTISVN